MPRAAIAVLVFAAALIALSGCSTGSGDPPSQPGTSLADFIGYWVENEEGSLFNITIKAGETPGTASFIAPIDRCVGAVTLSGATAALTAFASAYYDDIAETITVNPDSPWETVYTMGPGEHDWFDGIWTTEFMGNTHALAIEFDDGTAPSGNFEYSVNEAPLYSGTFTYEEDGDDAEIEITYSYGTATLNAAKDELTLNRVSKPEPIELLKTTPPIPSLEDYEGDWYADSAPLSIFVESDGSVEISSPGGPVYCVLTIDDQGAGHFMSDGEEIAVATIDISVYPYTMSFTPDGAGAIPLTKEEEA